MTHLESEKINIPQSAEAVYNFLKVPSNHHMLMPEGIADFNATENTMHFTIVGTGPLNLILQSSAPYSSLIFAPHIKIPFTFTFTWKIESTAAGCLAWNELDADMNMMIQMLAKRPLENFIRAQAEKLPAALQTVA